MWIDFSPTLPREQLLSVWRILLTADETQRVITIHERIVWNTRCKKSPTQLRRIRKRKKKPSHPLDIRLMMQPQLNAPIVAIKLYGPRQIIRYVLLQTPPSLKVKAALIRPSQKSKMWFDWSNSDTRATFRPEGLRGGWRFLAISSGMKRRRRRSGTPAPLAFS